MLEFTHFRRGRQTCTHKEREKDTPKHRGIDHLLDRLTDDRKNSHYGERFELMMNTKLHKKVDQIKSNSCQRDQLKNYCQVPTANFLKYIGNSHAPLTG